MAIQYRLAYEYSSPSYYDIDTEETLWQSCDYSKQCLWVVSWDTQEKEIIEWLEQFNLAQEDEARAYIRALEKNNGC